MDLVLLSRLQFALTIMFHYLFPPLTIGMALLMVFAEGIGLWRKDADYLRLAKFWSRLFAVSFAVGVASGIVMEFQFGTNWSTYSRFVGDVFGSALAAEGIFAFFLESGFLAVVVFGWNRVSPRMHFFATCMVFCGSVFSSVWIVVANSWQQTPSGFHIVQNGQFARAEITDFWAMVFNPSAPHRLNHVILGCFLQGAFFILSVSAFYVLKNRHVNLAKKGFDLALGVALLSGFAILMSGHMQAKKVAETQPAKLAAFESHFATTKEGASLCLFGVPDETRETVDYALCVPGLLSFLVYEDLNRPLRALDSFPREDRPPVMVPFQSYHLMVASGMFMIAVSALAAFLRWRGQLYNNRYLLWLFVGAVAAPVFANQAGWVAAEVGRQPWVVYGLLRTADGVSRVVPPEQVLISIILFSFVYLGLFAMWLLVLHSKIQHGPDETEDLSKILAPMLGTDAFRQAQGVGYSPASSSNIPIEPAHTEGPSSSNAPDSKKGSQ